MSKKKDKSSVKNIDSSFEESSVDPSHPNPLLLENSSFSVMQNSNELYLTTSSNLLLEDDSVLGVTIDNFILNKKHSLGSITIDTNLIRPENSSIVNIPETLIHINNNIITGTSLSSLIAGPSNENTFTHSDNRINPTNFILKLNEPIMENMVNLGIETSQSLAIHSNADVYLKATTIDNLDFSHCGNIRITTEDNLFIKDGMLQINDGLTHSINANSGMFFISENKLQIDYQAENIQNLINSASTICIEGTQSLLSTFTLDRIGSQLDISFDQNTALQTCLLNFSDTYANLYKPIEENNIIINQLPNTIATYTPYEMFKNAELFSLVTCEQDSIRYIDDPYKEEVNDELEGLLSSLNEGLVSMLEGARSSLHSNNPDKVRHFSISLRELFTHVLHILSPNEEIKKWSNDSNHYIDNKPTRRARLLYICRSINHDSFAKFVKADVDAVLSFINLFQGSTHSIEPNISKKQLDTMLTRMESLLTYLIRTGNNN